MRLLAMAMVLSGAIPDEALREVRGQRPPEHFLFQSRKECHFQNGTQRVRYLDRYFWDRQEAFYFDSDLGRYVTVTELGRPDVERVNQDREWLRNVMANADSFCRHNYDIDARFSGAWQVRPIVTITPTDHDTAPHNILLICNVGPFYPPTIEIKWFKNGEELDGSQVWRAALMRNGDWSFQTEVMLETRPEKGDIYACWVDHTSFKEPVTVQWEAQSDAARSKIWTGAVGFVLGLVFVTPGVFLYVKNKKALMN